MEDDLRRRSHQSHGSLRIGDEDRLAELGYKQELKRNWSLLHNFGVSFSIIVSQRFSKIHPSHFRKRIRLVQFVCINCLMLLRRKQLYLRYRLLLLLFVVEFEIHN